MVFVNALTLDVPQSQDGAMVADFTHQEAMEMSAEQLRRFIALIETLDDSDWGQATACSLWTVKDIVAHQAAHVAGFTSVFTYLGQQSPFRLFPYLRRGMSFLDAWNQSEVERRRSNSPAALIAEIRDQAEASLKGKDRIPAFLRNRTLSMPGLDQARSLGYVIDLIYTRDMWMHHVDICRATGRKMALDNRHDARTVALIVRDLALKAQTGLNGRSAILELTGAAGGRYRMGGAATPTATLVADAVRFCVLTSGRAKAAQMLTDGEVTISGDGDFGREVWAYCENRVLF